jgi:hypothetical protein
MALTPYSETSETQKRVQWVASSRHSVRVMWHLYPSKRNAFELKGHGSVNVFETTRSSKDVGTVLRRRHSEFSKQVDASLKLMCSAAKGSTRVGLTFILLQFAVCKRVSQTSLSKKKHQIT